MHLFIVHNEGLFKKVLAIATIGASIVLILLTGSRAGGHWLNNPLFINLIHKTGEDKMVLQDSPLNSSFYTIFIK